VIERVATTEHPHRPCLAAVSPPRPGSLDSLAEASVSSWSLDRLSDPGNARHDVALGGGGRRRRWSCSRSGSVDLFNTQGRAVVARARCSTSPVVSDVSLDRRRRASGGRRVARHVVAPRCPVHVDADWSRNPSRWWWATKPTACPTMRRSIRVDHACEHHGRAESLNVAMATTVLVFEVARQRSAGTGTQPVGG
jgi:TrmH family RNA methyltransferase